MDPADLLYLDGRRVETYYSQIGGSKRSLDLVGKIKLAWNPSAELTAKQRETKASLYEKIEAVRNHLDKQCLLSFVRPKFDDVEVDFVEEVCSAWRVTVPADRGRDPGKKMTLWFCEPELDTDKVGILVLVQDFNHPDEKPTSFRGTSTFSVLSALVHNTRNEIDESIIGSMVPQLPRDNPYAVFGTESHPASLYEYQNVKPYIYDFAANPVPLLKSWNCHIDEPRRIRVVYKVREWGREAAHGWQKTTAFGYPIWIFASP